MVFDVADEALSASFGIANINALLNGRREIFMNKPSVRIHGNGSVRGRQKER